LEGASRAGPAKPRARTNRAIALGAGAFILVLIATAVCVKLLSPVPQSRATPGVARSLAVLPLENFSGNPNQQYFADGMTDELITELANIGGLTVISRKVVKWSVTRIGDTVRITVQLIDAPTDKHIWAKSYESQSRDVLKLQATLASEIATQIKVELTPNERARLANAQAVNPESYEAYLKGRNYLEQAEPNALASAQKLFERAIKLDPKFAPAYTGLADVYSLGTR
jgi:TolB-like protein